MVSFVFCTLAVLTLSSFVGVHAQSPYDSGYDHGCDDADISNPSDRYTNQPEKGPSFHTDEFNRGYNEGFDSCSDSNNKSDSEDDFQSEQPRQNLEHSLSSTGSGWTLSVKVMDKPFGTSTVWLGVKGPYGLDIWDSFQWREIQSQNNPDIAYVDFYIPPNEIPRGKEFKVCGSTEPITAALALNCEWWTHTGNGDNEVSHSLS